jgi:hypothetical protein
MSQAEKCLQRMRVNPRDDWTIDDIETICRDLGLICRRPSSGSHYTVSHRTKLPITIPRKSPIKPVYIKLFVKYVGSIRGSKP